jgi:hypothetical protein
MVWMIGGEIKNHESDALMIGYNVYRSGDERFMLR